MAEDSLINIYSAQSGELLQQMDTSIEYFAIASNGIDKIALGGVAKQVDIHTIPSNGSAKESFHSGVLSEPLLALKFQSQVQRILWVGNLLLAFSEDSEAQLFNTQTEQVVYFKPGHEGSVLNGAIDPLGEFVVTTGTDQHANIYRIVNSEGELQQSAEFVKKIKITREKVQTFGKVPLDVAWTADG